METSGLRRFLFEQTENLMRKLDQQLHTQRYPTSGVWRGSICSLTPYLMKVKRLFSIDPRLK
uniref:Putative ovule protein n=1 Tax=Solanum chacoense TaxID=4108 RepID=A0A0V0I1J8_SOLCH